MKVLTLDLAETLAEKVLSFLRRYAQHRAGLLKYNWDVALVRHIYDVCRIVQVNLDTLERAKPIFKNMLMDECSNSVDQVFIV